MRLSFSRVDTYKTCPYRFDLRYNKGMVTFEKKDNTNALYLGTALHMAIEKSPEEAVEWYLSQFPISTDEIIEEAMKLSAMGEKAHNLVQNISRAPVFEKNVFVHDDGFDFLGFIDCLMPIRPGHWAMLDFKYSSNVEHYSESPQLPIYKHYFEKMTGEHIDMMAYLICPKIGIRRKDGEDTESFRLRLREEMEKPEWKPMLIPVENSEGAIEFWYEDVHKLMTATEFPKKEGKLCWWCDYREYCQDGSTVNLMEENDMLLPKNERVPKSGNEHWRIWLYGESYSGKTYLADKFPNVLMLNSDGNTTEVTAPRIRIADQITVEGRITKHYMAWSYFKDVIKELEKGSEFETIVLDLYEDFYEFCRQYMYDKLKITHESDQAFSAWDKVRSEFFSTMKGLFSLPYNFILISQEDKSRDITNKSGDKITAIKPNINDKVAVKTEGLTTFTARVIKESDNKRWISFKTDDVVFGGGRIKVDAVDIPCTYEAVMGVLNSGKTVETVAKVPETAETQAVAKTTEYIPERDGKAVLKTDAEPEMAVAVETAEPAEEPKLKKRGRKPKAETDTTAPEPVATPADEKTVEELTGVEETVDCSEDTPEEEQPVRRKRRRRTTNDDNDNAPF